MTRRRILALAAAYLVACWALIGYVIARAVSS
jgi:hypothetical protein